MIISIIAAVGLNNELGKNNDLIWNIPSDLKFFKNTTLNHNILMGKNTFFSLKKPLKNRKNIVITDTEIDVEGIVTFSNINDALEYCKNEKEIFVIGGATIYKQFIDIADKIYLTEINDTAEADVFFPIFNKNNFSIEVLGEGHENGVSFKHILYTKVIK